MNSVSQKTIPEGQQPVQARTPTPDPLAETPGNGTPYDGRMSRSKSQKPASKMNIKGEIPENNLECILESAIDSPEKPEEDKVIARFKQRKESREKPQTANTKTRNKRRNVFATTHRLKANNDRVSS